MKKMAKVLALALALCMALSVSAFADNEYGSSSAEIATKTLTINVDVKDDTSTEPIALLVVKNDLASVANATDSTIYFIDQKPAVAGKATFTAPIAEDVDMVDIYVGSSTIAGSLSAACKVGDDVVIKNLSGITISAGETAEVKKIYNIGAKVGELEITRPVVAIKVNVKNVNILKMIWAIRNGSAVAYSNALELSAADYSSLDGDTWITGVFGTEQLQNIIGNDITDVDAIFLAADGETEYYTNEADKAGKKD